VQATDFIGEAAEAYRTLNTRTAGAGTPNHSHGKRGRWSDPVRVVPREMPLLAAKIDREALRVIQQALLDGRQVEVSYTRRGAEREAGKHYTVNPLGLVARGSLLYLACTLWEYEDFVNWRCTECTRRP
jgi:hypothetical protein